MVTILNAREYRIIFIIVLVCIFKTKAQVIDPMLNQPDLTYVQFDKSSDDLFFLHYYDSEGPSPVYAFDEINFELLPFEALPYQKLYVGSYIGRDYFVGDQSGINILYEYNGSIITEYELPESYSALIYLATFNDKIYFAAQIGIEDADLLTFDGAEVVASDIPEALLGGGDFHYSEIQNTLFLRLGYGSPEYNLWSFNGEIFQEFPNPTNLELAKIEFEFNNKLILSYFDTTANTNEFHLYTYDGISLEPIESPNNTFLLNTIGVKEERLFLLYEDKDTEVLNLYEYDGTDLTAVETDNNLAPYRYVGELNGKEYFIVYRNDTSLSYLYSYDGNELIEIPGPPEHSAYFTVGVLNNKLLLAYQDNESRRVLVEYIPGNSEATIVPNAPNDLEFLYSYTSFPESLFISYRNEMDEKFLYGFNNSGFIELEVPETYLLGFFEFKTDQHAYFMFYSQTLDDSKLFRIDRTLNVTEFEQPGNTISIFPNPTTDQVYLRFSDLENLTHLELTLFTLEGKKVDSKYYASYQLNDTISYNTANLNAGVYLLEIKSNIETVGKRILIK